MTRREELLELIMAKLKKMTLEELEMVYEYILSLQGGDKHE